LGGVITLDGATLDRTLIATAAANLSTDTPILLITSRPSFWNQLVATAGDLLDARPNRS